MSRVFVLAAAEPAAAGLIATLPYPALGFQFALTAARRKT
jgi:hypothetical protein